MGNRVWVWLSDEEVAEVEDAAAARGIKPSALARQALLGSIRSGELSMESGGSAERLAVQMAALDRAVQAMGTLVPALEEARAEQEEVRQSLREIASAVGTLAGAIELTDIEA